MTATSSAFGPPPTTAPSGLMPVRNLKVAVFNQATMALLMTTINAFTKGTVIAAAGAQPGYAAGFSAELTFLELQLEVVSTTEFVAMLLYVD